MNNTNALSYMLSQLTLLSGTGLFIIGGLVGFLFAYFQWKTIAQLSQVKNMKSYLFFTSLIRFLIFFLVLLWVAYPEKNIVKILIFFIGFMIARIISIKKVKKMLKEQKYV